MKGRPRVDAGGTRPHDPLAGHLVAGALGGAAGAAGTLAASVVTRRRPSTLSLAPRLLLGASASAGVALLANAATGSGFGERLADATWGNRHKAGFALRNLHRPHVLFTARDAVADSRAMEARLFGPGRHGDDGIDALRHAYAAGLLAARLVHDHGMSAEAAFAIVDAAGRAHERDTDPEDQHALSSHMDHHNNAAGARVGLAVAAAGSDDPAVVLDRVLHAHRGGQLVRLDGGLLRPTRPGDLPGPS